MLYRSMTAAAVTFFAGSAMANHVDFIVDGPFVLDGEGSVIAIGDGANILGGLRLVGLSGNDDDELSASFEDGNDFISFNAGEDDNATLLLDYGDFPGGNGPLNSDFDTNWNFVSILITEIGDTDEAELTLSFESGTGNGVSDSVTVDGEGFYDFSFDDPAFDNVDFEDVDRVTVSLSTDDEGEIRIGSITRQVVPAPAPLALLGLGGLVATRRRR